MVQDTVTRTFDIQTSIPGALAMDSIGPVQGSLLLVGLILAFALLLSITLHVVMSLQKATTARSSFWRAAVAACVAAACAGGAVALLDLFHNRSWTIVALSFASVGVLSLAAAVGKFYLTTVARALVSALLAFAIVPALVALLIAVLD